MRTWHRIEILKVKLESMSHDSYIEVEDVLRNSTSYQEALASKEAAEAASDAAYKAARNAAEEAMRNSASYQEALVAKETAEAARDAAKAACDAAWEVERAAHLSRPRRKGDTFREARRARRASPEALAARTAQAEFDRANKEFWAAWKAEGAVGDSVKDASVSAAQAARWKRIHKKAERAARHAEMERIQIVIAVRAEVSAFQRNLEGVIGATRAADSAAFKAEGMLCQLERELGMSDDEAWKWSLKVPYAEVD